MAGKERGPIVSVSSEPTTTVYAKHELVSDGGPVPPNFNPVNMSIDGFPIPKNYHQLRRKTNHFLDSGAMTGTVFDATTGASVPPASNSTARTGGIPAGPPIRSSYASSSNRGSRTISSPHSSVGVDICSIHLEGEETDSVPIFDSCDEIRRKINAHLKKPGVTQAQFLRDILAQLHEGHSRPPKGLQSSQLARFRGMKGALAGASSPIYYGAYVLFEKARLAKGKPKTKHRLEMEKRWDQSGVERTHRGNNT